MPLLLLEDVTSRKSNIGLSMDRYPINMTGVPLYNESNGTFYEKTAIEQIKHWRALNENSNVAFASALDAFNLMLEHSTSMSAIRTACSQLVNESRQVTNAKELKRSIKYKMNAVKRKLKPFSPPKKPKPTLSQKIQANSDAKLPTDASGRRYQREKVANECYDKLLYKASKLYEADRIIENYNKISKRFNLDKIFKEYALGRRDLYTTIYEVAGLIATFSSPFMNLYTTALECCWYGFGKRYLNVPNKAIIETVTDFYVFSEGLKPSAIEDIKSIRDTSPIFEKADFGCLTYLNEAGSIDKDGNIQPMESDSKGDGRSAEPKIAMKSDFYKDQDNRRGNHKEPFSYTVFEKPKGTQGIPDPDDYGVGGKETAKKQEPLISKLRESLYQPIPEENSLKVAMDTFRSVCNNHETLEANLDSFYQIWVPAICRYYREAADKIDKILTIIRNIFIFDLGEKELDKMCTAVYDIFVIFDRNSISLEQCQKCIDTLSREIAYCQAYIDKNKNSGTDLRICKNMERYILTLGECLMTMKEYAHEVLRANPSANMVDPLQEAKKALFCLNLIHDIQDNITGSGITNMIVEQLNQFNTDMLMSIAEFSNTCPEIIDKDYIIEGLNIIRAKHRNSDSIVSAMKVDSINEVMTKLNESEIYGAYKDMDGLMGCLMCVDEIVRNINKSPHNQYITEASCIDTIHSILDDVRSRFASARPGNVTGIIIRTFNNFDQSETCKLSTFGDALREAIRISVSDAIHGGSEWLAKPLYLVLQAYVEFYTAKGVVYDGMNRHITDAIQTLTDASNQCTDVIAKRSPADPNDLFIRFCAGLKKQLDIAIARINYAAVNCGKEGDK